MREIGGGLGRDKEGDRRIKEKEIRMEDGKRKYNWWVGHIGEKARR